jgi:hypothetical protein
MAEKRKEAEKGRKDPKAADQSIVSLSFFALFRFFRLPALVLPLRRETVPRKQDAKPL